jgi:hypothetical protein
MQFGCPLLNRRAYSASCTRFAPGALSVPLARCHALIKKGRGPTSLLSATRTMSPVSGRNYAFVE